MKSLQKCLRAFRFASRLSEAAIMFIKKRIVIKERNLNKIPIKFDGKTSIQHQVIN